MKNTTESKYSSTALDFMSICYLRLVTDKTDMNPASTVVYNIPRALTILVLHELANMCG